MTVRSPVRSVTRILGAIGAERNTGVRRRPNIWVVVPCMGRLEFLKKTAPTILAQSELNFCLVDYSCPDRAGEWFRSHFADAIREGRATVVDVLGRPYFEKSKALNAGGREALLRGAEYVGFLDGDTLLKSGFGSWLVEHVRSDRFIIAGSSPDGYDVHCLMGLVIIPSAQYAACGGYDEEMVGWGGEDIEMRLRLHVLHKLRYRRVPFEFLDYIDHGDELRVKHHILSMSESNRRNLERTRDRVRQWTGRDMYLLGTAARRLIWWPQGSNCLSDGSQIWRLDLRLSLVRRLRKVERQRLGGASGPYTRG